MNTFAKLHDWIQSRFGLDISKNTLILVSLLLVSLVFLIFSLITSGGLGSSNSVYVDPTLETGSALK